MPTPIASEVPRVSVPSSTPSAAHAASTSQPAAIARSEQPHRRQIGGSALDPRDHEARDRARHEDREDVRHEDDPERRQLRGEHVQAPRSLREARLQRVPPEVAAHREHAEHEREHAAEEREADRERARERRRQEVGEAARVLRPDPGRRG